MNNLQHGALPESLDAALLLLRTQIEQAKTNWKEELVTLKEDLKTDIDKAVAAAAAATNKERMDSIRRETYYVEKDSFKSEVRALIRYHMEKEIDPKFDTMGKQMEAIHKKINELAQANSNMQEIIDKEKTHLIAIKERQLEVIRLLIRDMRILQLREDLRKIEWSMVRQ